MAITQVSTSVLKDGAVTSAKLDTNIAIDGNLTVDTDTLYVDSANNRVGIGTTSPSERLEISSVMSTSPTSNIFLSAGGNNALGGGGSLIFGTSATAGTPELYNAKISGVRSSSGDGSSDLLFATTYVSTSTSPITRLTIKDTGNVGIGTDSPSTELHVKGSAEIFRIDDSSSTGSPFMTFFQNGTRRSLIQHLDSGDLLSLVSEYGGVRFMTGTGGTEVERMRIHSGGDIAFRDTSANEAFYWDASTARLGIGTGSSPSAKLHVYNSSGGDATSKASMLSEAVLKLQPHATNSTNLLFAQVNGGNGIGLQVTNSSATANWDLALSPFGGNVGIGTTNPGYKLHVAGNSFIDATSASATLTLGRYSGQPTIKAGTDDSGYLIIDSSGGILGLNWYSSDNIAIAAGGGNVCIGATSPVSKLTLEGARNTNTLTLRSTSNDSSWAVGDKIGAIDFYSNDASGAGAGVKASISYENTSSSGATNHLSFRTAGTTPGTNNTERMRITSTGNIQIGTASDFYLAKYSDSQLLVQGPYGNIRIGPANSSYAHFATDRSTFYFGNNIQIGGGIYDYQDTNYYLDPASLSRFNQVNMDGKSTMKYTVSDLNNVGGSIGVTGFKGTYQASNKPGIGNYATGIEFTYHDSNARTQLAAASSGNNDTGELWVRSEAWSTSSWSQWWKLWHQGNDGSGSGLDADLLDGIDSGSFVRSDANDTLSGQYTFTKTNDHAIQVGTIRGTAVGSQTGQFIQMYERVNIGGPNGWGASNTATPSNGLSTYGGTRLAVYTSYTESGGSMRAPIFYDSNDTNYYIDPAGDSSIKGIDRGLSKVSGWVPAYGSADENNVSWSQSEDAVKLQSPTDLESGMAFKARRIAAGQTVRFSLTLKANVSASSGMYIRLYVYNGDLPDGKTHTSGVAYNSSPFVQEASAGVTNWRENVGINTSWTTEYYSYTATADCYVSMVVLNWTGVGTNAIYVKNPDIQTIGIKQSIYYDLNDTAYYVDPASTSRFSSTTTNYVNVAPDPAYAVRFWNGNHNYSIRMSQSSHSTYGGRVAGETTSDYNMYFTMAAGTNRGFVFRNSNSSSGPVAGIDASGNGRFNGDVVAYSSSDERLKDNKKNINNALEKVESLNGVEFDWNDKQDVYEGHDIGVIAQEVEKIAPELVSTRDNGYKAVKYEKLVPLLIEAIKELSDKVKALENK